MLNAGSLYSIHMKHKKTTVTLTKTTVSLAKAKHRKDVK